MQNSRKIGMIISRKSIISFLLVFYIVFFSDSFYCTTLAQDVYEELFQWSLIIMAFIMLFALVRKIKRVGTDFFILLLVIFSMIASMYINSSAGGVYFYKIAVLIFGYCYAKLYSLEDFLHEFKKLMCFLMVISLAFYVWYIIGLPVSFLPTIVNTKGNPQYTIFFSILPVARTSFLRIKGPFSEPGVYAAYLSMALYFDLILSKNRDIKYIICIIISLLLTFSTTGYATAIIIAAGYIFDKTSNTAKHTKIAIIAAMILSLILVVSSENLYGYVFGKIDNNTESMRNRWNVISGNIEVIKQYPIFGAGPIKSKEIIMASMRVLGSRWSFSNLNTILAHWSVFGVFCAAYYIYYLMKFVNNSSATPVSRVFLLISMLVLLSCFGFQFSLFYGIVYMLQMK